MYASYPWNLKLIWSCIHQKNSTNYILHPLQYKCINIICFCYKKNTHKLHLSLQYYSLQLVQYNSFLALHTDDRITSIDK